MKNLERIRPKAILDLIKSGESISIKKDVATPTLSNCEQYVYFFPRSQYLRCGYISSQKKCKACLLLEGLNTGNTDLGVKKVCLFVLVLSSIF